MAINGTGCSSCKIVVPFKKTCAPRPKSLSQVDLLRLIFRYAFDTPQTPENSLEMYKRIKSIKLVLTTLPDADLQESLEVLEQNFDERIRRDISQDYSYHYGNIFTTVFDPPIKDGRVAIWSQSSDLEQRLSLLSDYMYPGKLATSPPMEGDLEAADTWKLLILLTTSQPVKDFAVWFWSQSADPQAAQLVQTALERKANPDLMVELKTALHHCRSVEVVKALVSRKASIDIVSGEGRTPLLHAMRGGYPDVAEALLLAKANPKVCDRMSFTASYYLKYISFSAKAEALRKLL